MSTQAQIAFGLIVSIGNDASPVVYTPVAEVTEVSMPEQNRDTVDVTHFQSPGKTREFLSAWGDAGEFSLTCNFIPAGYASLKEIYDDALAVPIRVALPSPATTKMEFTGVPTGLTAAWPIDDAMRATVTFKVSGQPTFTA